MVASRGDSARSTQYAHSPNVCHPSSTLLLIDFQFAGKHKGDGKVQDIVFSYDEKDGTQEEVRRALRPTAC